MTYGKLFGVGVGPGAPDLMTLRAVNTLKAADVIAIPRRSQWDDSVAWRIAQPNIGEIEGQERLFLTFPMSKTPERCIPAWETAFGEIGKRLEQGRSVAFITEGDPLLYSTFIYLHKEAPRLWPGINIEIVPGVSSITAVAAAVQTPIADGQERVAVLPASYGLDDLADILRTFDTVLLTKVSSVMPQIAEVLEKADLLEKAVYVSRATMDQEKIVHDIAGMRNNKCDYFSMVMISRKERDGVLANRRSVSTGARHVGHVGACDA